MHVVGFTCREITLLYVKLPANAVTTASELAIPRYPTRDSAQVISFLTLEYPNYLYSYGLPFPQA